MSVVFAVGGFLIIIVSFGFLFLAAAFGTEDANTETDDGISPIEVGSDGRRPLDGWQGVVFAVVVLVSFVAITILGIGAV
jgi:amino acid transporter